LNKLKTFKIPPAYDNVFIINSDKIIAYGYDSKKRNKLYIRINILKNRILKNMKKLKLIKDF